MNTERETRTKDVSLYFDWDGGVEISQMKKDLDDALKLGATHMYIGIEEGWDEDTSMLEVSATYEELETDEQYEQRIALLKQGEEKAKAYDLRILAELKAKYETEIQ